MGDLVEIFIDVAEIILDLESLKRNHREFLNHFLPQIIHKLRKAFKELWYLKNKLSFEFLQGDNSEFSIMINSELIWIKNNLRILSCPSVKIHMTIYFLNLIMQLHYLIKKTHQEGIKLSKNKNIFFFICPFSDFFV